MKHRIIFALCLLAAASSSVAAEKIVTSRVTAAGLFKNGLAVVTREVPINGTGIYCVTDVPSPVHGTFWIESEGKVTARVTQREMQVDPVAGATADFQQQLVGKRVTVYFRHENMTTAAGTVVALPRPDGDDAWNRQYQQPRHYGGYYGNPGQPSGTGRFLILENEQGREYLEQSSIARVTVREKTGQITERRPVLMLAVADPAPETVRVSYLARGLSWAPSYRVDISDKKQLTIAQKAVIKNELGALQDAELSLISGFPSVQFGHVVSPLSLSQTLTTFFQQLSADPQSGHGARGQMTQQIVMANYAPPSTSSAPALPMGEGPDIHYQEIGPQSMTEGDALMLAVDDAQAEYRRIVEWIVPDTRKADGRHVQDYERQQNPDKYREAAWDALQFKNPLPFPMTTGPAMIVGNGKFLGQRTSFWVNAGEETTLHVTKALSLRTRSAEQEEPDTRKVVYVGGDDYHQTTVKGELEVSNHRAEAVTLLIRRRFSGELLDATDDPLCTLREEGAWCVNKRNELTWTLKLKPGEKKTFTYRYKVLVNR